MMVHTMSGKVGEIHADTMVSMQFLKSTNLLRGAYFASKSNGSFTSPLGGRTDSNGITVARCTLWLNG